jgi:hypothetical protein
MMGKRYMAGVGVNAINFPKRLYGTIVAIVLFFYGLSGTFYSQMYNYLYPSNNSGYLLFLLLSVGGIFFLFYSTMFIVPYEAAATDTTVNTSATQEPSSNPSKMSKNDEETQETSLTPLQMASSISFWALTTAFIFQQGLTYISNISLILDAASPTATAPASQTALHLTLFSVFQAAGRFLGGLVSIFFYITLDTFLYIQNSL